MRLKNLKTNFLARNNIYYRKIDSTQSEIWRLIESKNVPNGTLVFADLQTQGKGTHGRKWYTDEENNIAFSFFIKMDCNIKQLDGITTEIARVIVNIFEEQYTINLNIKEPNDIVYNNKKIGGILTETKILKENVKYLVIGIGINTEKQHFNKEIENIATSIKKEFDIDINTANFITEFCNRFEQLIINRQLEKNF